MRLAHQLVTALALLAIISSSAPWAWKAVCATLLLLVHAFGSRSTLKHHSPGLIRLYPDGTASRFVGDVEARSGQCASGWVSRWFSVVALKTPGSKRLSYCLVCASENHPDDYRRMLQYLRMRSTRDDPGLIW